MMAAEWRGLVRPWEKTRARGCEGERAHAGKSYDRQVIWVRQVRRGERSPRVRTEGRVSKGASYRVQPSL